MAEAGGLSEDFSSLEAIDGEKPQSQALPLDFASSLFTAAHAHISPFRYSQPPSFFLFCFVRYYS